MSAVDVLLNAVPEADRDKLFPLLKGAAVVEELTTKRPNPSTLFRWAEKGRAGVTLQTVTVGRDKCTTRRWFIEFFVAVAEAEQKEKRPARRNTRRAATGPRKVKQSGGSS